MTKEKLNILITEIQNLKVVYKKKYLKYKKIDNTTEALELYKQNRGDVLTHSYRANSPDTQINNPNKVYCIENVFSEIVMLKDYLRSRKYLFKI